MDAACAHGNRWVSGTDNAGAILSRSDILVDLTLAAREIAEKLADQLRAAQGRINELETNVRYYQDRTERAEKWMYQISSEIQQKFLGGDDTDSARRMAERPQNLDKPGAMPRPSRQEPATPSFLRRLATTGVRFSD